MRITPLRGQGVAWLKCPSCHLKCRPTAVGADGLCPRCGKARMLKLAFGGRTDPQPPAADESHGR